MYIYLQYMCTLICLYTLSIYMYICIIYLAYKNTYIPQVYEYIYIHTDTGIFIYIYIYIYVYVNVYMFMNMYIHIFNFLIITCRHFIIFCFMFCYIGPTVECRICIRRESVAARCTSGIPIGTRRIRWL